MKIMTIVGARPQFIKAAAVSRELRKIASVSEHIVHTGQHYDPNMSDIFFDELRIPKPTKNLGIGGGSHGQNTGRMLEQLEAVMLDLQPDMILVYGDTDSTLAGALAASKLHLRIAHVEAGLRSFNRQMPEEINRVLTDHVSSVLFAPTGSASANLEREGIAGSKVHVVGDVMYDACMYYRRIAKEPSFFGALPFAGSSFALCTVHRAENTDFLPRLKGILEGIAGVPLPVLFPVHPRTRKRLDDAQLQVPGNVTIVDPVGYLEMTWLEAHCALVMTDSGGVQKEAYFHGKPCITFREETEWTELIDLGVAALVGTDPSRIKTASSELLLKGIAYDGTYGDGDAARKIVRALTSD